MSKFFLLLVALFIASSYAAVHCSNTLTATSVLESDGLDITLTNCDEAPICQLSCSKDYAQDFNCDMKKNPTPVDPMNDPYAIDVLLDAKLGISTQYTKTCIENSDSTSRILKGMKFLTDKLKYENVEKAVKGIPTFIFPQSKKNAFLSQVKAGLDLAVNQEFQNFWVHTGRKCSRSIKTLPNTKVLADFQNQKWSAEVDAKVKLVGETAKWPPLVLNILALAIKSGFDKERAWVYNAKETPNVFLSWAVYLANLRSVCKCRKIVTALTTGDLPDESKNESLKNPGAANLLLSMGRDLCAQKYNLLCLPKNTPKAGVLEVGQDEESLENTF